MMIDPATFELHNLSLTDGKLRVRNALVSLTTPTSGTVFVQGFSLEAPSSSEVFHYLFEQSTTTHVVTMRMLTEEFETVFQHDLGVMQDNPCITYGVSLNQLMINSPSFSAPLYGLVGGGICTAVATSTFASDNPDQTAIAIPPGHITAFGDRLPIAQGNILYFNDPAVDPRTYVGANAVALPGQIHDIFTGPEGALYAFTSKDCYVIPADALGHGQIVQAFMSTIPGLNTSKPRNAAASNGVVACLARDGLVLVSDGQKHLDLAPYKGARHWSPPVSVEDYRTAGQLFATSSGFLLGFGAQRDFYLRIDLRSRFRSYVHASTPLNLVGVLRGRDGEDLVILRDRIVQELGNAETVGAVACGRAEVPPAKRGVVRSITVASNNVGEATRTQVAGVVHEKDTPTKPTDVIVGQSTWENDGTVLLRGRTVRTTRHQMAVRTSDLSIEIGIDGCGAVLERCDLEIKGQALGRRDRR